METVPRLGLGTWQNTDPTTCAESVEYALGLGYRHIDTAQAYENEEYVGEGLAQSSVDREEVFLATKVHDEFAGLGFDRFHEAAENRLDALGVDVLDLLYVHWPIGRYESEVTLPKLDRAIEAGFTRHAGVSNFTVELLEEARAVLENPLYAHQAECHPFLQQDSLIEHAQEHDYTFVAYSPLARGDVFESEVLTDIADKHDVSAAQVSLAWLSNKDNVAVIPKATSREHIRDNWAALDLTLDPEDVEWIEAIDRTERYVDRDDAAWYDD
jgi:2,5-diketo-D-gluconate reductase B